MAKKTTNRPSNAELVVMGAAVAGLAATAYFFFGPNGKKHQKHAKAWAIKMKGEVVEKLELARDVTKPIYDEIIDAVATEYKGAKLADQSEIDELVGDLKKHWQALAEAAKHKS